MQIETFDDRKVSDANPLPTKNTGAPGGSVAAASLSSVSSSAASQTALAANAARKGVLALNTDENACLVKYGATASAGSFSVRIASGAHWEMTGPIYTGVIDVIWEADGSGALMLTEL